jgi:hypothetical protein
VQGFQLPIFGESSGSFVWVAFAQWAGLFRVRQKCMGPEPELSNRCWKPAHGSLPLFPAPATVSVIV